LKKFVQNFLSSRINPWLVSAFKVEAYAVLVGLRNRFNPKAVVALRDVARQTGILANIGCGPTGLPGWVNIDLFQGPGVNLRMDCRRKLPFADGSCRGIHVEHYFEHMHSTFEKPRFLAECRRSLEPGGILRIIVPDARKYAAAYVAPGWAEMNKLESEDGVLEEIYATKIEVLNHTFMQTQHYGGLDEDFVTLLLQRAGFADIQRVDYRQGRFPGGPIDQPTHRPYSLYIEACR
jgi:predicted SAM-dependent methyltransferase